MMGLDSVSRTSCCEVGGIEEMGTQKISVSDKVNGFQYTSHESDSFIVDMESFSQATDKDITPNSRITLQRNLSRKGPQRGGEKRTSTSSAIERDTSSPRAALGGPSTPEKAIVPPPVVVAVGTTDRPVNPQVHHQITITAGSVSTTAESRLGGRRYGFRRAPLSWVLDPKKILFLFATLSSMGSILLIYLTLFGGKVDSDDNALDWQ